MNLTSHHLVASSEAVLRSSLTLSRIDSLKLVARKLTSVVPLPHKQLGGPAWQSGEIEVCLTFLPATLPPNFRCPDPTLASLQSRSRTAWGLRRREVVSFQQEREGCSENGQGRRQRDPARVLRTEVGVLEADRGPWVYTACPGEARAGYYPRRAL